ncbi:hypothetical protein [Gilliamella sp. Occ4-3]|uniref:hypothetical protein n=1 Tax=Gilliamella sp. Occ4-3 TaxID=3120254 RepID=UPI000AC7422D|nr:hypothetical protein [Gilliamella apicola]
MIFVYIIEATFVHFFGEVQVDDKQIKKIQYLLNTRPRKRHKFKSPADFYSKELRRIALHGVI